MARKGDDYAPRRVTSDEDRKAFSSDYLTLDEGEHFIGYALFAGDPTVIEPGWYEFYNHWDDSIGRKGGSVPCAGDRCPLCRDGDRPRNQAKTLWFVTKDNNGNEVNQVRTFNLNGKTIKQFTEMRAEGSRIKGRAFRISKLDGQGNFGVLPKDQKLSATEVKEHLKTAPDFEAMLSTQLRKNMERLMVAGALDDTDDDEEDTTVAKAKGGKSKAGKGGAKKWPESGEDVVVTVVEADEENFVEVTADGFKGKAKLWGTKKIDVEDLEEDAKITVSWVTDDDDDFVLTDMEPVEDEEPEEEEKPAKGGKGKGAKAKGGKGGKKAKVVDWPDSIEELEVEAAEDGTDDLVTIKCAAYKGTKDLYTKDGIDFDLSEVSEGDTLTVSATQDDDGDFILDDEPESEGGGGDGEQELPDNIEDATFTVVDVSAENQTIDVENDELGLSFTLYFLDKGPGSKVDFDEWEAGDKFQLTAEKDTAGDMVCKVDIEKPKAKGGKKGGKAGKKKGGKGKGK